MLINVLIKCCIIIRLYNSIPGVAFPHKETNNVSVVIGTCGLGCFTYRLVQFADSIFPVQGFKGEINIFF